MVEVSQVFLDRLPKLRKYGINTTGLTPHRAVIPMITKVAEACHKKGVIFSCRVSIDGVGEDNQVCQVKNGFNKANETIAALRACNSACRSISGTS